MTNSKELFQSLISGYTLRVVNNHEYKLFLNDEGQLSVVGPWRYFAHELTSLNPELWELDS